LFFSIDLQGRILLIIKNKMKIGIVGYGKMGKAIEKIVIEKAYSISGIIATDSEEAWQKFNTNNTDVIIEFTQASEAPNNILKASALGIPIVCGTTGWWDSLPELKKKLDEQKGKLIYGGNFSPGMNLMFSLNEILAGWMNKFPEYDPWILEKHHKQKQDAPGGSALELAHGILKHIDRKSMLQKDTLHKRSPEENELSIAYIRSGSIFGDHETGYSGPCDEIRIQHQAHSREGFARGALLAAEWIQEIQGIQHFPEILKAKLSIS